MPKKNVIVIGSGFAGLSAATHLAASDFKVTVLEKNSTLGGRARQFVSENGFTFDMGPSWYWMPEIFDHYFEGFGRKTSDFYALIRLDPSYSVTFKDGDVMQVPAKMNELEAMFERYEAGSAVQLRKFLAEAKYKYDVGINEFVQKPSHSVFEFMDLRILRSAMKLDMFSGMATVIRKYFKNEKLIELLEFPGLFLGATPQKTPALYSLMNYADMSLGTWYPMGGMYEIVKAMVQVAKDNGVVFHTDQEVLSIETEKNVVKRVITADKVYEPDLVVATADYNHIDQKVLAEKDRNYSEKYWQKRTMAPSSLLFYLGVSKKLKNLNHHNLFFDEDFSVHSHEIYETPKKPSRPLFYVSVPSVTDSSVAPDGCENVFFLMPIAPNLPLTEQDYDFYYDVMMTRLEKHTAQNIRDHIIYKRAYAYQDFVDDYHAFKGNAYGLANTLMQTAFLKPKLKHKTIKNLWFAGQLTTPGPGVPPSIISGQVAARDIIKQLVS